jgi:predicted acylesterase/phospholipase RssA
MRGGKADRQHRIAGGSPMSRFGSFKGWVGQKSDAFLNCLQPRVEKVREFWAVLMPCRFSILMMLAGCIFLLYPGQGPDTLREFIESWAIESTYLLQQLFFFFAAFTWAVGCWYFARLMLSFSFPDSPETAFSTGGQPETDLSKNSAARRIRRYCVWVPRVLGSLCLLSISLAYLWAGFAYRQSEDRTTMTTLFVLGGIHLIFAFLFFFWTLHRRSIQQRIYNRYRPRVEGKAKVLRGFVELFATNPLAQEKFFHRTGLSALRSQDWFWITLYGILAIVLFFGFIFWPVRLGQFFGACTILLFAAGGWITFGTLAVYAGSRCRVPILTFALLAALVFSLWNDNHVLRTLDSDVTATINKRPTLAARFDLWLNAMNEQYGTHVKHPLIVVAAAGGGIRAAFWTASVLSELQDRNKAFARHVFAISGVSGGSIGSAVFAALVAEQVTNFGPLAGGKNYDDRGAMRTYAEEVLKRDFLGPLAGKLLYPDLTQRFVPFPINRLDRALAVEEALEDAWAKALPTARNHFANGFLKLWPDVDFIHVPALFLNATWVETGKRIIVSNVRITSQLPDAVDFHDVTGKDIPLSTATHMSARFPYVSPAGTLQKADSDGKTRIWGHVVDGGYFENSGAATAYDIFQNLLWERPDAWEKINPVILIISNDPKEVFSFIDPTAGKPEPTDWIGEVWSPIETLLRTREARGTYSQTLVGTSPYIRVFHFGLCDNKVPLPLGWQLSQLALQEIRKQLTEGCKQQNNASELDHLSALLSK